MTHTIDRRSAALVAAPLAIFLLVQALSSGRVLAHSPQVRPSDRVLDHEAGQVGPRIARHALVVGNAAYETAPLKNPVNDATDMAEALGANGFEVTLGTDWTKREMEDAIRAFGSRLRMGGVGLFYFAGHGIQVGGRNYLVPIGFRLGTESDVEYEAVDAGRVLGQMEDAGNGVNVVILDACRSNPFGRDFRSAEQGLAQVAAPTGSFIGYATAPGSVAADGRARNGTYTAALLEALRVPGLKVEDVFKRVRQSVARETAQKQVPWDSSSLVGDFYFMSPAPSPPPTTTGLAPVAKPESGARADGIPSLRRASGSVDRGAVRESMKRAREYFATSRDADALQVLASVLDAAPNDAEARLLRGRVYERTGNYDLAIEDLGVAAERDPNQTMAYVTLGRIYVARGDCANAQAALARALRLDPASKGVLALKRTVGATCQLRE